MKVPTRTPEDWRPAVLGWVLVTLVLVLFLSQLVGCAAERELWTWSSVVPIEFRIRANVPRVLKTFEPPDYGPILDLALRGHEQETGRKLDPVSVGIYDEDAVPEDPKRTTRFQFLVSPAAYWWDDEGTYVRVRIGEVSACSRADVGFPRHFRRALLEYLRAQAENDR